MKVSNRLRVLRAERRWSQMETGRRARVSTNRLWRFENGYAEPTAEERDRLARAFRVSVEDIFPAPEHVTS